MRLAGLTLLAALVAAPLAAQAAPPPTRFAVTLQGTIVDRLTYERVVVDEECTTQRTGKGGRGLTIRSLRPTMIEVTGGTTRVVYRPPRMAALRVAATSLAGEYVELRSCRFLPPERRLGKCRQAPGSVRRLQAGFRSARNSILFGHPGPSRGDVTACGLDRAMLGGWLNLVRGRIDEGALLNGRSRRVFARAARTREGTIGGDPTLTGTQQTTVRWTLTFRRLG